MDMHELIEQSQDCIADVVSAEEDDDLSAAYDCLDRTSLCVIFEIMERTHNFVFRCCRCCLKKSSQICKAKSSFFGPVTFRPSLHAPLLSTAIVPFFLTVPIPSGRCAWSDRIPRITPIAGRFLFLRHFVKEYIMTITNHIQKIQSLCHDVFYDVDHRNYQQVKVHLVNIDIHVRAACRHIERLQNAHDPPLVSEEDKS